LVLGGSSGTSRNISDGIPNLQESARSVGEGIRHFHLPNLEAAWGSPRNLATRPPSRMARNNLFLRAGDPISAILGASYGTIRILEPKFKISLSLIWMFSASVLGAF
jgi:hypothetical protein